MGAGSSPVLGTMLYRSRDGWETDCWGGSRFWGVPPHPSWSTLVYSLRKVRKVERLFEYQINEIIEASFVDAPADKTT